MHIIATVTLIKQESDITAGALKVNDAYDLKFRCRSTGNYEVITFMNGTIVNVALPEIQWK